MVHHAQSPRQGSYPAPTTLLLSTETPQTHRRLTTVRRNTIEAHLCIAELVTRAAFCLYLPLTATRSEKGPAMASPSSLLGEVAKGAPWQYLHTNMVLGETVDGWCWQKCREQDSHACWYLAMSRLAEVCHRCRHSRTAPHGSYPASTLNGNTTHSICTVDWEGQAPASADSHRGNENLSCHAASGAEFRSASMTVASTKVTTCETTARISHGVPVWLMNA